MTAAVVAATAALVASGLSGLTPPAPFAGPAVAAPDTVLPHVRVTLAAPGPGDPPAHRVSLVLEVPPGWAVYASDPGPFGLPLEVTWTVDGRPAELPELSVAWPGDEPYQAVPEAGAAQEAPARVHRGRTVAAVRLPGDLSPGTRLGVTVRWAACRGDLCVPGASRAVLELPGDPAASPRTDTEEG